MKKVIAIVGDADISGDKQKFDLVFNTVPAPIIADEQLESCRAGCLVVELASAPGGVDRQAAERHGIRLVAAPGLPGKTAPVSTAEAMAKTVLNIFKEQDI